MDITNEKPIVAPWFRRIAALSAALALAACSADIDDSSVGEAALDEQADALVKADAVDAELSSKELAAAGSGEASDAAQSTLKAGGGSNFECTTECGGGGGCCTCYGVWDCILLGGSGQCKSGTFGCGGDGCMCDWKVFR